MTLPPGLVTWLVPSGKTTSFQPIWWSTTWWVGSDRGALPGLLLVGFPGPPAEPGVRLSAHRALHGCCRQAGFAGAQGVGIVPR